MLSWYRNQSIDLHSKSIDWFLYEGNTGTKWINVFMYVSVYAYNLYVIRADVYIFQF